MKYTMLIGLLLYLCLVTWYIKVKLFKNITDNLNSKGSSDWEKHVSKGAGMFKELLKNYT